MLTTLYNLTNKAKTNLIINEWGCSSYDSVNVTNGLNEKDAFLTRAFQYYASINAYFVSYENGDLTGHDDYAIFGGINGTTTYTSSSLTVFKIYPGFKTGVLNYISFNYTAIPTRAPTPQPTPQPTHSMEVTLNYSQLLIAICIIMYFIK